MPHLRTRSLVALLSAVILLTCEAALGAEQKMTTVDRVRERVLRMTDFLDTMLPGVLDEHNMTLHFRPKFGDLRDEEYIRFPLELRYGYTNRLELQGGIVPFTPSPINSGRDHRWGLGEAKLGARYDLGAQLNFFDETTVGLETRIPLGKPPVELNDHYTHVKPFISAARTLLKWPSTTFYSNISYDRSVKLTRRAAAPPEVIRRHIVEVSPGLLFKPAQLGYFAEYRFRHIEEENDERLAHEIQFGTIWDIPLERSEQWRLPGKWQLEVAYKVGHEEGRETDHGISARVNWRTTLREVLEHAKSARLPWDR
jgi:hypothetical protein